jgi:hypothetical protein
MSHPIRRMRVPHHDPITRSGGDGLPSINTAILRQLQLETAPLVRRERRPPVAPVGRDARQVIAYLA